MSERGHRIYSSNDLEHHSRSIIEGPWIRGCPLQTTRAERKAGRSRPPAMPAGTYIYFSDGTSRDGRKERNASCDMVLKINGIIVARLGIYL